MEFFRRRSFLTKILTDTVNLIRVIKVSHELPDIKVNALAFTLT
jgi:hypothetical protein